MVTINAVDMLTILEIPGMVLVSMIIIMVDVFLTMVSMQIHKVTLT